MGWKDIFLKPDHEVAEEQKKPRTSWFLKDDEAVGGGNPTASTRSQVNDEVHRASGPDDARYSVSGSIGLPGILVVISFCAASIYGLYRWGEAVSQPTVRVSASSGGLSPGEGATMPISLKLFKLLQEATPIMRTEKGQKYAAFFVAPHVVVTANHCLLNGDTLASITVKNVDLRQDGYQEIWRAKQGAHPVVIRIPGQDVAVLVFPSKIPQVGASRILPLAQDRIQEDEQVYACGHPFGKDHIVSGGTSAGRIFNGAGFPIDRYNLPLEPGNSGGPIIDAEGTVHGVAVMTEMRTRAEEGYGSPISFNLINGMVKLAFEQLDRGIDPNAERHCFIDGQNMQCVDIR